MAGSGKTSLMQRLNAHLHTIGSPAYIVNLDPAVHTLPYEPNIDIRDTVNYKEVMKQYALGPNGGEHVLNAWTFIIIDGLMEFGLKAIPHIHTL